MSEKHVSEKHVSENHDSAKANSSRGTKVQRAVAAVLTIAFIPLIFAFGLYGVLSDPSELVDALRYSHARNYLASDEEGKKFFPMLKARILSLENALGDTVPLSDGLSHLNASFQYALGKRMVAQGEQMLLSLQDGQIYNMTTRKTLAPEAMEIVGFYEQLGGSVPFLFAYVNPQFYDGGPQMPAGYDVIDTGDELADEVLGIVRGAGIEALDSRTFFAGCGFSDNDLNFKTDMHWTTLAALLATRIYAEKIEEMTGVELDLGKIDLDRFEEIVYPDLFLGEYAQQLGERNAGLDDITFYLPEYDTQFTRHSIESDGTEENAAGDFSEAIVKWDALDTEPDGTNIRGYVGYGLVEGLEEIVNESDDCADLTLLIFRDSYTAPVGSFLSLMVKNVVMVDMRKTDRTAMDFVAQYDPDMVIVSLSRQMLEDHGYDMGSGYAEYLEEYGEA